MALCRQITIVEKDHHVDNDDACRTIILQEQVGPHHIIVYTHTQQSAHTHTHPYVMLREHSASPETTTCVRL